MLSFSLFVMSGCEAKLNPNNFKNVKVGMSLSEVERILGPGKELFEDDPELPRKIYIPTPEERENMGMPNQRWFRWLKEKEYIVIGVEDDEVFMTNCSQ